MANIEFTIKDNSKSFLNLFDDRAEAALEAVGLQAERHAKEKCPVVTGRLRNSITYATHEKHDGGSPPAKDKDWQQKETPDKKTVYIGTNVEYAPAVELGGGKRKAHHFLKSAAQNHASEYKSILQRYFKGEA